MSKQDAIVIGMGVGGEEVAGRLAERGESPDEGRPTEPSGRS